MAEPENVDIPVMLAKLLMRLQRGAGLDGLAAGCTLLTLAMIASSGCSGVPAATLAKVSLK